MTLATNSAAALGAPRLSLLPRADRPWWWIVYHCVRGTWFLVLIHVGAAGVLLTTPCGLDYLVAGLLLPARALITTVAYHRYFAHRSFKTSRAFQFVLACLCCTNLQRGPLWWAAIHRQHHGHSDQPGDTHSPVRGGFWWAYCGWMFATLEEPDWDRVRDLLRFPELVWLERFWLVPPALLAAACWLAGGWTTLCLVFCVPAVAALHGASVINTLGHLVGSRRYATADRSRNSWVLALITFGDGWHNNHHHYPHAARAGFFWWETDLSYRLIQLLECGGLVWGVRDVPRHKLSAAPARSAAGGDGS
jgi:stearoyl-CoA desaturase (delta-9 desaturase)